MGLRPFRLSTDLRVCADILPQAFRYPDNPAWDMQLDEEEGLVDLLGSLAGVWPVVKLAQTVFPSLRDYVRGYVWEEGGQPVGVVLLHRYGRTGTWEIARVAVLPAYRRRGIGRALVQAGLDLVRKSGGDVVLLEVIAGNVPACSLYEQVGFDPFETRVAFDYGRDDPPPEIALPEGYVVSPIAPSDWRCKYDLARRIVPPAVQAYRPVREAHFRPALPERLASWIEGAAGGVRAAGVAARVTPDGSVVGTGGYLVRTRPGGVNGIDLRVDPAHAGIATALLYDLLRTVLRISPGRRIAFVVPGWQEPLIEAARASGCERRFEYRSLGLRLA
jgi:ribosomal protein S18 acetylase RimI-like enzyme